MSILVGDLTYRKMSAANDTTKFELQHDRAARSVPRYAKISHIA